MELTLAEDAPPASRLITLQDREVSDSLPFCRGTAVMFTSRAPNKQSPNEDALAVLYCNDSSGILAVADGMGGHAAGERASQLVLNHLRDAVTPGSADDNATNLRGAILNAIEAANQQLIDEGTGSGTTLAVVEVDGQSIRAYHIGDSSILLFGQRGRIKLQTIAHSPVGYAVEAGLLSPEQAIVHDERHVVSNMVGAADMRIEIGSPLRIAPFDTLLIASDGLTDNLHVDEIVAIARKGPLVAALGRLVELARSRMEAPSDGVPCKPDDLSIILFRRGR